MSWDAKSGSKRYYYRSVRDGDRVRKIYLGCGPEAEKAAREVEQRRIQRKANQEALRREQTALSGANEAIDALQTLTQGLYEAFLVANGCYQHHGQWRRRRHARDGHHHREAGSTDSSPSKAARSISTVRANDGD